jgi:hypothetical protein
VGAEFFHAVIRTDITRLIVAFRKIAKSARIAVVWLENVFRGTMDMAIKNAAVFD